MLLSSGGFHIGLSFLGANRAILVLLRRLAAACMSSKLRTKLPGAPGIKTQSPGVTVHIPLGWLKNFEPPMVFSILSAST